MFLSPNMIYQILALEDPQVFREKMITNNLFSLTTGSKEDEIYRRTGRSTALIINALSSILEGNKIVLIYCKNQIHYMHLSAYFESLLQKLCGAYPIKYSKSGRNLLFENLNSKVLFRNDIDAIWTIEHDIIYRDEL